MVAMYSPWKGPDSWKLEQCGQIKKQRNRCRFCNSYTVIDPPFGYQCNSKIKPICYDCWISVKAIMDTNHRCSSEFTKKV